MFENRMTGICSKADRQDLRRISKDLQNPGTAIRPTGVREANRREIPPTILPGSARRSVPDAGAARIAVPGFCKKTERGQRTRPSRSFSKDGTGQRIRPPRSFSKDGTGQRVRPPRSFSKDLKGENGSGHPPRPFTERRAATPSGMSRHPSAFPTGPVTGQEEGDPSHDLPRRSLGRGIRRTTCLAGAPVGGSVARPASQEPWSGTRRTTCLAGASVGGILSPAPGYGTGVRDAALRRGIQVHGPAGTNTCFCN